MLSLSKHESVPQSQSDALVLYDRREFVWGGLIAGGLAGLANTLIYREDGWAGAMIGAMLALLGSTRRTRVALLRGGATIRLSQFLHRRTVQVDNIAQVDLHDKQLLEWIGIHLWREHPWNVDTGTYVKVRLKRGKDMELGAAHPDELYLAIEEARAVCV